MTQVRRYLLVISCSERKNKSKGLLPAMERYTGPRVGYDTIYKLKREKKLPSNLNIVIISAKYGFLKPNDPTEDYDLRMNKKIAEELNCEILSKFRLLLKNRHYDEICIRMSKDHLPAIKGLDSIIPTNTKVIYLDGSLKAKGQMKNWILSLE